MKLDEMFPSKWLKASDLQGKDWTLTIDGQSMENLGEPDEPAKSVLHFKNAKKGLVLNRTNAETIAAMHGYDSDAWVGKEITLFATTTLFKGRTTDCIRIRAKAQEQPTFHADPPPAADDDDMPF